MVVLLRNPSSISIEIKQSLKNAKLFDTATRIIFDWRFFVLLTTVIWNAYQAKSFIFRLYDIKLFTFFYINKFTT